MNYPINILKGHCIEYNPHDENLLGSEIIHADKKEKSISVKTIGKKIDFFIVFFLFFDFQKPCLFSISFLYNHSDWTTGWNSHISGVSVFVTSPNELRLDWSNRIILGQ